MRARTNTGPTQDQQRRQEIADELFRFHAEVNRIVSAAVTGLVADGLPVHLCLTDFQVQITDALHEALRRARE